MSVVVIAGLKKTACKYRSVTSAERYFASEGLGNNQTEVSTEQDVILSFDATRLKRKDVAALLKSYFAEDPDTARSGKTLDAWVLQQGTESEKCLRDYDMELSEIDKAKILDRETREGIPVGAGSLLAPRDPNTVGSPCGEDSIFRVKLRGAREWTLETLASVKMEMAQILEALLQTHENNSRAATPAATKLLREVFDRYSSTVQGNHVDTVVLTSDQIQQLESRYMRYPLHTWTEARLFKKYPHFQKLRRCDS